MKRQGWETRTCLPASVPFTRLPTVATLFAVKATKPISEGVISSISMQPLAATLRTDLVKLWVGEASSKPGRKIGSSSIKPTHALLHRGFSHTFRPGCRAAVQKVASSRFGKEFLM